MPFAPCKRYFSLFCSSCHKFMQTVTNSFLSKKLVLFWLRINYKKLNMNILIISPKLSESFFSYTNALKFVSKKSIFPPKELLLISILLPITWKRKMIDLNIKKLKRRDILWADYIFVSAQEKQYNSTIKTIKKCNSFGRKIVASGSLFTEYSEEFENVEHLVLDDIRKSLPKFIVDLENKNTEKVYHSNPFFEIRKFTESYYSLKNISDGFSQNIQLSHA